MVQNAEGVERLDWSGAMAQVGTDGRTIARRTREARSTTAWNARIRGLFLVLLLVGISGAVAGEINNAAMQMLLRRNQWKHQQWRQRQEDKMRLANDTANASISVSERTAQSF